MLLYDEALPRSFWKLARVLELITGRDGNAVVKAPTKNGGTTTLRRPLQLLYPLEIKCKGQHGQGQETAKRQLEGQVMESPNVRVPRRAAAEARDWMNACLIELEETSTVDHSL